MEVGDRLESTKILQERHCPERLMSTYHKNEHPSTIFPDELLTVRFPDLKEDQVIIPSTTKLTFNISLAGTDANRTLVKNLGRNIIRKLVEKLEGNEIISTDDYDVLFSILTAGNARLRGLMQSFKV